MSKDGWSEVTLEKKGSTVELADKNIKIVHSGTSLLASLGFSYVEYTIIYILLFISRSSELLF